METTIKIRNVSIGDKFHYNGKKNLLSEVVDILECRSLRTGQITGHVCIAKPLTGMATNTFDVSFTTVVRFRVAN